MSNFRTISTIVMALGVLLFPLILLSAFFVPVRVMSIALSLDALIISLASLVIQHPTSKGKAE